MDIVDELNLRLKALTKLPEGRTPEEDKRIDEEIEAMVFSPENQAILDRILDAEEAGDGAEADRLRREMIYSPDTFVSNMLHDDGREFIKKVGYRLDTVEMKYGKGWLDREYP
jgi:hypothetical protein